MALAGHASSEHSDEIVSFPQWRHVLDSESSFPADVKQAYLTAILGLLRACKLHRRPLSAGFIRWYLESSGLDGVVRQEQRAAFKWLFVAARSSGSTQASTRGFIAPAGPPEQAAGDRRRFNPEGDAALPSIAAADQGGADWERDLVTAIRRKGFLWRTEKTYRDWAARFAKFIAPRSPYAARGDDVTAFLTSLAVQQRAAASTQKQALNALVFLMQEALRIDLGEMDFQRARARERVPTVLSKEEVKRLLERLPDGYRLMGEVMYGSGLRLMELLRLRVQHLDLERARLQVMGGKGDRVNGFADAAALA